MRRLRFPPSPAHPGSAGLGWGLAGTRSRLHQPSCPGCSAGPGSLQPSLSRLPSLCFWLQFFVCLVLPFFCCLLPSFLCWPFLPFSFFMRAPTLSQGFPSIPPSPFFLPVSTILFPFPLSAALSRSFPLSSQLQLELIRYLSSSAKLLVASRSSPGEVSRAGQLGFSMQPQSDKRNKQHGAMGTSLPPVGTARRASLARLGIPQRDLAHGVLPGSLPGHPPPAHAPALAPDHPVLGAGGCFWWGAEPLLQGQSAAFVAENFPACSAAWRTPPAAGSMSCVCVL